MGKSKSNLPFFLLRVLIIVGCVFFLFVKYNSEHPKAIWDSSPDTLIISYELGPTEIPYGYIPDFRIWGDGRIVWVINEDDTRKVFEGYLQPNEMKTLIEKFVDAGYFNWFGGGGGNSYDYMRIRLSGKERDGLLDTNEEISKLVDYIKSGAGVKPKEFLPTIGYLYVFPIEETEYNYNNITVEYVWPEDKFGFALEDFYEFVPNGELTDEKLSFIWQVVNHSNFIDSNGKIFLIGLEIPKITY